MLGNSDAVGQRKGLDGDEMYLVAACTCKCNVAPNVMWLVLGSSLLHSLPIIVKISKRPWCGGPNHHLRRLINCLSIIIILLILKALAWDITCIRHLGAVSHWRLFLFDGCSGKSWCHYLSTHLYANRYWNSRLTECTNHRLQFNNF